MAAPLHSNELERLQVLREYQIVGTPPEPEFDEITHSAQQICNVPIALITLIDEDCQWFKSKVGVDITKSSRDTAFCAYTILQSEVLIVPDMLADERFAHHPLVTSEPYIRFYAGAPLLTPSGYAIGTLCILDYVARQLTFDQITALELLSRRVVDQLQHRRSQAAIMAKVERYQQKQQQRNQFRRRLAVGFGFISTTIVAASIASYWHMTQLIANEGQLGIQPQPTSLQPIPTTTSSIKSPKSIFLLSDIFILGMIAGIYAWIYREMVRHWRIEDVLEQQRDFTDAVLDTAKALVVVLDRNGSILRFNRTCEQVTGYFLAEVQGKRLWDCCLAPEDVEMAKVIYDQPQSEQFPNQREYQWITKNNDRRLIHWSNTALLNSQGQVEYIINTGIDITKRREAEKALQRQQEWLEVTLSSIGDAVIATDTNANVVLVNLMAESLTGWSSQAAIKQSVQEVLRLVNIKSGQEIKDLVNQVLEQETILSLTADTGLLGRNNEVLFIEGSCAPIKGRHGQLEGAVLVFRDITIRKQIEEQTYRALAREKELSELKSGFVSLVSHEFRTPLTTILSSAELLDTFGSKLTIEKQKRCCVRIQTAVKRMTNLLDEVLIVNTAEAGKLSCNLAPLNLEKFCRDLVTEFELIKNNHQLIFVGPSSSLEREVWMDQKLLHHIFINLLSNAIKYSPEGSTVRFELTYQDESAILTVQDEGIGIPPEDMSQLFTAFHRSSNVGNISGTGLGLSIVKTCVDLQAGTIDVESKVGFGTTFTVTLPLNSHLS
jgi:hypothetical protein